MQDAGVIIGIIGGILGMIGVTFSIVLGVSAYRRAKAEAARTAKKDICQETTTDANLVSDVKYIVRSVDAIKDEQRGQRQDITGIKDSISDMRVQIARVEESTKSAHKRLDTLAGCKTKEEETP